MVAAMQMRPTDYQTIRSRIKCAFAWSESGQPESVGADMISPNGADHPISSSRTQHPGQTWNTRVHATPSRRPGRSRVLIWDQVDTGSEYMLAKIGRLQKANQATLSYFYDSNSVAGKHPAKSLVWASYLPQMSGCGTETKATALNMLDHLLPCYRYLMLQGEMELPKQPWQLFESIKSDNPKPDEANEERRRKWYKTYRQHWKALLLEIERLDHAILDLIR